MSDPEDISKFDPNKPHPKAGMTDAEKQQLNNVKLKLREAGVVLDGQFKWHIVEAYLSPVGFDFMCSDPKRLMAMADNSVRSKKLGNDFMNMPGYDPWAKANLLFAGYSSYGSPPVHLDITTNGSGLCRVYIIPDGVKRVRDSLQRAVLPGMKKNATYWKIAKRLAAFEPPIYLDDHVGSKLDAKRTTLDGIDFVANDHNALLTALRSAKDAAGKPAFAEGFKEDFRHFALSLSFRATEGIGFREIWRPRLSDRPVAAPNPRTDPSPDFAFSSHFGDSLNRPDFTSIHCAVSPRGCNIHIDEMGFVMEDANGNLIVNPDAVRHLVNELLVKTNLQGTLPSWALDRFNFHIWSSPLEFSGLGASFDLVHRNNFRVTVRGSCRFMGGFSHSETVTLGWRF